MEQIEKSEIESSEIITINENEEPEFLDRTRTFKGIETLEDIFDVLEDYENVLFPDLVTKDSIFVFNLIYMINGNCRTLHLDGLSIEGFKNELLNFHKKIEKYEEEEDEGLFQRFLQLKIRQRNRAFGYGNEMYLTTIENDEIYFQCYTKTIKRCIAISAIKHEEPHLRTKIATELDNHKLILNIRTKKLKFQDEIIDEIEKYYNKEVIILSPSTKINYDQNKDKILLSVYNNHVGYITKDYPYILDNKQLINNEVINKEVTNEENKNRKYETLQALFFWDLEFEWEKENNSYISKNPNLICMTGLIKTKSGFTTTKIVKRNMSLMMSFLINMANLGLVFVYSVNGAKIEHQKTLKEIIENYYKNIKSQYIIKNTIGSKIKTLRFGPNLRFFDTVLLLPMSLSDMAINFDTIKEKGHKEWETYPKTKKIWNEKLNKWDLIFDKDEWYRNKKWDYKNQDDIDYCMNDCEITMEAMMKYNRNLRDKVKCSSYLVPNGELWVLGNSSISSIGKQTLLNYYPDGLNCNASKSLFQETYIGGRCEIFYHGYLLTNNERKLISIDINSSYPYQATKELPYKLIKIIDKIPNSEDNLEYKWGSYCWITYKNKYQIPPLGIKRGGNLYFPNLDENTLIFLWDFEYNALKDNLIIHKVSKTFIFTKVTFKSLFENWYEMKKTAPNKVVKTVAKQLLNGTTGGLGLKQVQPVRVLTKDVRKSIQELNLQTALSYDAFNDYQWLIYNDFIVAKTMFHTISYITALGRWQLWNKCMECKRIDPECKILRLDTDGITVYANKELSEHLNLTSNEELGGWDYEEHEAAYIRGLKKYCLDNKVVFNGINSKLKENLSMIHLTNESLITDNEKWLQRRNFDWENKIRSINMSKEYEKGKILENGDVESLLYSEIKSLNLTIDLDREFLLDV